MTIIDFFSDHTFRTVLIGTVVVGVTAGALGCFTYLRKQTLIADVVSHSALPGAMAFFLLASVIHGINGRNLIGLAAGSLITGSLAAFTTQWLIAKTKLKPDAAMSVSLVAYFSVGMLLLNIITQGDFPEKGGIQNYLFGNASTLTQSDLIITAAITTIALIGMLLFWKELKLASFDINYASASGFKRQLLDGLLFTTVVTAIVIGVKAVGLILMIAFVISPAAAARQWTRSLRGMVILAAAIGGGSASLGSYLSVQYGNIPTGPVIVLILFIVVLLSLFLAPRRGLIAKLRGKRIQLANLENEPVKR